MIHTLKKTSDVFRTVPLPLGLLAKLEEVHDLRVKQRDPMLTDQRIWTWCRTTAWTKVKQLMQRADVNGAWAVPKGLRHGLAVVGTTEAGVPLNVMQRWLGHARIETTAIYTNALGPEERALAERMDLVRQCQRITAKSNLRSL